MELQDVGGPGWPATTEASARQGRAPKAGRGSTSLSEASCRAPGISNCRRRDLWIFKKKLLFLKPISVTLE